MEFTGKITEIKARPEEACMSSVLTIEGAFGDTEGQVVAIYGKRSIIIELFDKYSLEKEIKIKIGD